MDETKRILVDGKEYHVTLKRFDEDIDPENGAVYHGFYLTIVGNGLQLSARKYDDAKEINIQDGLRETDTNSIAVVRKIAKELFGTEKLTVLTAGDPPYKEIQSHPNIL